MKYQLRRVGITVATGIAGYFLYVAIRNLELGDLSELLTPATLGVLMASALVYTLIIPISGWAWSILLHSIGTDWSPCRLTRLLGLTQLAKYVPGNMAQLTGRTALAVGQGMPAAAYATSVVIETLLTVAAGLAVGVGALLLSGSSLARVPAQYQGSLRLLSVCIIALMIMAVIFVNRLPWLARISNLVVRGEQLVQSVSLLQAFAGYCLNYFLVGLSLWLISLTLGGLEQVGYLYLTASFALAWLLGFIAPGAPAGLGVREGAMLLLLTDCGPSDQVLTMIVAMRISTILGDVICFSLVAFTAKSPTRAFGGGGNQVGSYRSSGHLSLALQLSTRRSDPPVIRLGGLHASGSGYPNARRTLDLLRERLGAEISECGTWLPESLHLWREVGGGRLRRLRCGLRLALGNLDSAIRVWLLNLRVPALVYVPYPGIFFMWLMSWLPSRWRPKCIVDAYVSTWDSMFRDRGVSTPLGWASRAVKRIEGRAYRAAAIVATDTEANRDYLAGEFSLDPGRVASLPLAIEEEVFLAIRSPIKPATDSDPIGVLFVGTLVPLHGVEIILEAIRLLLDDKRLHFRLVGDGQAGPLLERFLQVHEPKQVEWIREWRTISEIAREIAEADICLGVFGGKGKASRVLPFKLYMYLAAGKPVISQAAMSLPQGVPAAPIATVTPVTGELLAEAISGLAVDPARRQRLGEEARQYYCKWLSNERVAEQWKDILVLLGEEENR